MLRRRHKKSRAGCSDCKKRHIKCDENRPICVNCSTASMKCSFESSAKSMRILEGNESMTVSPLDTSSRGNTPPSSSIHPPLVHAGPYVNATHVELFYWIIESGEWAFQDADHKGVRPHVLKYAFTYPFLLNELLAVSALHLSTCRPAQQSLYREEATRLQYHALRVFNETVRDLNHQNIIPTFLFSALQGIATFFETFHDPTYEASDWAFFEKIVQSVSLLQGVRSIVDGWWPFLLGSEIKDILDETLTPDPNWSDEAVIQFDSFRVHISQSPELDQSQRIVCGNAMEELVSAYKSAFGNRSEHSHHDRAALKFATHWLIVVPLAYTELLVQRKPESLVILGYFACMLHKMKAHWNVGNAGQKLLLAVEAHLDGSWQARLAWPKSFIQGD